MDTIKEQEISELPHILRRYKVKLRKENSKVTHKTYGTTKELNPEQFAVYEAAVKACYVNHFIGAMLGRGNAFAVMAWFQSIADESEFSLPYISKAKLSEENCSAAGKDYYICAGWLLSEGLYYDLLD